MSDTAPRSATNAAKMLADALLRSVGGACAQLRITATKSEGSMAELGLVATSFADVALSPVVVRKLRPKWQEGWQPQWELLVSASSVEEQISALDVPSAQALFAMTLSVTVAGQEYLIESIAANEAFGQVYLYRLQLREGRMQAV